MGRGCFGRSGMGADQAEEGLGCAAWLGLVRIGMGRIGLLNLDH